MAESRDEGADARGGVHEQLALLGRDPLPVEGELDHGLIVLRRAGAHDAHRLAQLPGRRIRTRSAQGLAVLFTLVCWTALFGLSDLADGFSGFVDGGRNTALDAGWGILFGIVVPVGLLAQLRSSSRVAGVHVLLIAGISLVTWGAAGEAWGYLVLGSATVALAALFVALSGERESVLRRRVPVLPPLLLLGAAAAVRPASTRCA